MLVGADGLASVNVVLEVTTDRARPMPPQDWTHATGGDEPRRWFSGMRFDWLDLGAVVASVDRWWQYPMVDRDPLARWSAGPVTLLGDAAHPMYPVGSNGASQAIIDARTLARQLALEPRPVDALAAYEAEGRPATSAIVLANRQVGAEQCMELAEARAPDGFERVEDVFAPGELEELSAR